MVWQPTFFLRRTFVHPDGCQILAYEDTAKEHWVVGARPAEFQAARPRWSRKTEWEAADLVFALMGDDPAWAQEQVWQ